MKRKINSSELVFMAICITLGLVCKRFIAPLTNILTDFIRLPGGSATSAFSILFLVIGASVTSWKPTGAVSGFLQAIIALCLGLSGNQGLFALVTFTVPGIVIDIVRALMKDRDGFYVVSCCALANIASAVASNFIVFRFQGSMLVLWLLVAACFGILAGGIGSLVVKRMNRFSEFAQMKYDTRRVAGCRK